MSVSPLHRPNPRAGRWAHLVAALAATGLIASSMVACGGAPPPPPAPVEARPTEVQPAAPDTRIWFVYWQGIHALTVFPEAGMLRPRGANAPHPFGTRHRGLSVVSLYDASEPIFAPLIDAADNADELIERLTRVVDTEVEEAVNPAYQHLVD